MKTKIILGLSIAAVITLSFTFVSVNSNKQDKVKASGKNGTNEPIGGFVSEEKL
jgi:hypothetical protein